jgi:flagellar hook-basal body complex protein FliE
MIEPIAPLAALGDIAPSAKATPVETGPGFASLVTQGVEGVNQQLNAADQATRALAAGADLPVHEVMIALEQARIDLQFVVQVRNRVLAAYHDITSMQV